MDKPELIAIGDALLMIDFPAAHIHFIVMCTILEGYNNKLCINR